MNPCSAQGVTELAGLRLCLHFLRWGELPPSRERRTEATSPGTQLGSARASSGVEFLASASSAAPDTHIPADGRPRRCAQTQPRSSGCHPTGEAPKLEMHWFFQRKNMNSEHFCTFRLNWVSQKTFKLIGLNTDGVVKEEGTRCSFGRGLVV